MEVLVHFIFLALKLIIQVSIYATVLLLIFRLFSAINRSGWFEKVSKRKGRFWLISGVIFGLLLILYSNSHWGSHGLGDSRRIPLKYGREIGQINGTETYLEEPDYKYGSLSIEDFAFAENSVVGSTKPNSIDEPQPYFIWNLITNRINFFDSKSEYQVHADKNDLPPPSQFADFRTHYSNFWYGWRFWLLL